jgi:glucosamine--fructose-6-phosphate aminotransferase (isomerizing)
LRGTFGLVILNRRDPNRLIAVRQGSPVILGIGDHEYFIASDVSALANNTRQVIFLDDGEIAEITHTGYRTATFDDVTLYKDSTEIDWEIDAIEKGGFDHYMLKEIHEQPEALENTFRGRLRPEGDGVRLGGIASLSAEELRSLKRILIIACGTSWHAGMIGEYQIEEMARIPVEVEYASEFRYRNPLVGPDDLVIVISQSGETADTLAALREAKERGALALGVINAVGSTIARETDAGIYLHAGPEIGVASTKAFTCQIVVLAMLALYVGRRRFMSQAQCQEVIDGLCAIPDQMTKVLEQSDHIRGIVEQFCERENWLFLGRGYHYPVALEGALKLKEISYIHAEGMPAAEMKHGPIALINDGMPVVFIATRGSQYDKVISNIEEVRARGGKIIAVATEGDTHIRRYSEHVIEVPDVMECLQPLLTVVPLQLIAYHAALARGCNVDKPRNLAKSVTVE